jgi:RimJ/RimL family protein N-acetyltransferase
MFSSEREDQSDNLLIAEFGNWKVRELQFTHDKIAWLWSEMNKYRSLFSDLTRGSHVNFSNMIIQPDTLWFEVVDEQDNWVGLLYVMHMSRVIDCEVHILFFDRKPAEKVHLCKQVVQWVFEHYPLRRMTATIPHIYYRTIKLAKSIGFKEEGRKRESQLMGNKWVDEVILGILRHEVV